MKYVAIYVRSVLSPKDIRKAYEEGILINREFKTKKEAIIFLREMRKRERPAHFCYPQIYSERTGKYKHVDPSKLI